MGKLGERTASAAPYRHGVFDVHEDRKPNPGL